jgi:ATP-dependent protease ClpP protease subunit
VTVLCQDDPAAGLFILKGVTVQILKSKNFNAPAILLGGPVDYDMYKNFRSQLDSSKKEGLVVTELSTLGGDPEVARMMGEDIRFHSENSENCRFVFLGKAAIYSAGTTFMSFFSIENRYLTRGTRLMIHERKLDKQLHINGPLTTCVATVTAALHEIEASIAIQNEGFENLVRGSKVAMDEVLRRAPGNWYIEANEAKALGLVAEVL